MKKVVPHGDIIETLLFKSCLSAFSINEFIIHLICLTIRCGEDVHVLVPVVVHESVSWERWVNKAITYFPLTFELDHIMNCNSTPTYLAESAKYDVKH